MAVVGILTMTKSHLRQLTKVVVGISSESMKVAGQEEKDIAIFKGRYHQGVSAITVTVDVGWCKRCHNDSHK